MHEKGARQYRYGHARANKTAQFDVSTTGQRPITLLNDDSSWLWHYDPRAASQQAQIRKHSTISFVTLRHVANAFALAPGIVLGYERNVKTTEELVRAGYEVAYEDDLLLGRTVLDLGGRRKGGAERRARKYVILMAAHELARARGGPRCMTMPLARDPL